MWITQVSEGYPNRLAKQHMVSDNYLTLQKGRLCTHGKSVQPAKNAACSATDAIYFSARETLAFSQYMFLAIRTQKTVGPGATVTVAI